MTGWSTEKTGWQELPPTPAGHHPHVCVDCGRYRFCTDPWPCVDNLAPDRCPTCLDLEIMELNRQIAERTR